MLGYTQQNNDIFVFFESDEISKLSEGKIQGEYINVTQHQEIGRLEAVIDEVVCRKGMDTIITNVQRNSNGVISSMSISVMQRVYDYLVEMGKYESHEGFRHIHLIDVNRIDFSAELSYRQLKEFQH